MWVLIENEDLSMDIVLDSKIITDHPIAVGLEVTVLYPDPKSKKKEIEYAAKVHGSSGKTV
jgi:hypothetical protein